MKKRWRWIARELKTRRKRVASQIRELRKLRPGYNNRCVNCGFLKATGASSSPLSLSARENDALASWLSSTTPGQERVECQRGVEINPMAEMYFLDLDNLDAPPPRVWVWTEAVLAWRGCPYFEAHRPGLSFSGHLELQHRREEWRRTALVAIAAAIIGGLIATLPIILFGQGVTVIVGR